MLSSLSMRSSPSGPSIATTSSSSSALHALARLALRPLQCRKSMMSAGAYPLRQRRQSSAFDPWSVACGHSNPGSQWSRLARLLPAHPCRPGRPCLSLPGHGRRRPIGHSISPEGPTRTRAAPSGQHSIGKVLILPLWRGVRNAATGRTHRPRSSAEQGIPSAPGKR